MISFITLTNSGYADYTLNCLKSLENIEFKDHILNSYCIGQDGYEKLISNNYNCTLIEGKNNISDLQTFLNENWSKITLSKFKIIHENLLKNDYVCITDGDIVYEDSNFFNYLLENIGDNELLIQNDTMKDSNDTNLCTGFMFIKSTPNTKILFNPEHVQYYNHNGRLDDQAYINHIKNNLKYKKLPLHLFPNGNYYYKHSNSIKPYLIHFNWLIGNEKKDKMIEYGKWYL